MGSADDHQGYRRVVPHLEGHFTVYAADRRGRGLSGTEGDCDFGCEVDDMVALAEAVAAKSGAPADIFAHSFGALVAGEAAMTPISACRATSDGSASMAISGSRENAVSRLLASEWVTVTCQGWRVCFFTCSWRHIR